MAGRVMDNETKEQLFFKDTDMRRCVQVDQKVACAQHNHGMQRFASAGGLLSAGAGKLQTKDVKHFIVISCLCIFLC